MNRMFGFYIAFAAIFMIQSLNAQVKIGEIRDGAGVITYNKLDLLRACEMEYDEGKTKFNNVVIKVFNKDTYWLFAGNSPNEGEYILTIKLVKSSENNDLFVEYPSQETDIKYDINNKPRLGAKVERYLKKY